MAVRSVAPKLEASPDKIKLTDNVPIGPSELLSVPVPEPEPVDDDDATVGATADEGGDGEGVGGLGDGEGGLGDGGGGLGEDVAKGGDGRKDVVWQKSNRNPLYRLEPYNVGI